MTTNPKPAIRWPFLVGSLGMIIFMLACSIGASAPAAAPELSALRLKDGIVESKANDGNWVPLAVDSTFDTTGTLESTNPWKVGETTFETRESTTIDEGLKAGDLVRVTGAVLANGTWVAYSIKRAEQQQPQPTTVLIGKVTSTNPWVVNGITLNVTQDTVITGDIKPGMLVKVEILLSADGTWEVLSIAPLGDVPETSGCVTVLATVVSVKGNEVQFLGWPSTVTLDPGVQIGNANTNKNDNAQSNTNEQGPDTGSLTPGQTVHVVLCSSDGKIVVTQIIPVKNEEGDEGDTSQPQEKVLICHKPNKNGGHTLSVAAPAVPAHLAHGDTLGACP